ncbi:response regulator [Tautonia plasticadhaerens]|uniref:Alkaline phosphatase synthesis transcriptional regulatory protein PhoP n=1 Tax=Tautonia plasticadhaerens TaxID=2527974 RepID=A0A518H4Q0_9BACT|nr:response regulator [Tautonia plasticadhaerens]QDV35811.1 Alkaline phosphatase synthesis transcriptional regulatory protein PhoP [Tautonia plasticadhaerens]
MDSPQILVIDDSPTILKMVECHLSQAGYRVATASNADAGVDAAEAIRPDLILLDHQLPGTTGDEVCRRLLAGESTRHIPVVISSAMRNRAFANYTELPNVVDQIPKPFTPDLLRTGVANALQVGAMVVRAQNTGCAMPEVVDEVKDSLLEGQTSAFPIRSVIDFLNNNACSGRLTLELEKDRIRFTLSGGRIQAVCSPTISPDRLFDLVPPELAELAPLLAATLGERLDPSMSGLVRMLERSLTDPRRLRALLRCQSAILSHWALTAGPGKFSFEADAAVPPMFQAFPLQMSLPALAVEGVRRCDPAGDADASAPAVFARQAPRGGNLDRTGLSPAEMKAYALFDGSMPLAEVAAQAGLPVGAAADVARGLELAGLVERRAAPSGASILVLDDDPEASRAIQSALGPGGRGCQVKAVRDRVGAQLLLRRQRFDLVIVALDRPDHEAFVRTCRELSPESCRFVGIAGLTDEEELNRLDAMGLDGILHRPISEPDLVATVDHLLRAPEAVACG